MASTKNMYNMFNLMLVLLCLFSIIRANDSNIIDKECQTPDNVPGICIPVRDCSLITNILKKNPLTTETKTKLRSYQCDFDNKTPKVCCPHKNGNLINQKYCGISPNDYDRLIGRNGTEPQQYPWNVLISYNTEIGQQFLCGGSLINENYVLTSAHCIRDLPLLHELMEVRLGEYDTSKEIDCSEIFPEICNPPVQDVKVSEIIPHPNYDPVTLENNIGLLRLSSKPVNFLTDSLRPICLPVATDKEFTRTELTVTGWGSNHFALQSNQLFHNNYKVVPIEECQRNYSKIAPKITIGNNQICLQEKEAGPYNTYHCVGERGDPLHSLNLIQQNKNFANIQFGIMSFNSKLCGNVYQPKILTNVASYINWILDNIKP